MNGVVVDYSDYQAMRRALAVASESTLIELLRHENEDVAEEANIQLNDRFPDSVDARNAIVALWREFLNG